MDSIILIPAYKPEAQMTDLVAALAQKNLTVVVVDDGSGAPYRDRFAGVEAHARLVTCEQNGGKGEALRVGLRYIREHFSPPYSVVTADADGQHRVKDILRVARVARRHPESLVLGCRTVSREMPLRNWFGNFYTKIAFFLATGRFFRDTQTGLRGFSDRMIPYLLGIRGNRYEYETNALLWWGRCGQPILEVPIRTVYLDGNSTSHFKAVRDSVRIYAEILKFSALPFGCFLLDTALFCLLDAFLPLNGVMLVLANSFARLGTTALWFSLLYRSSRKHISDFEIKTPQLLAFAAADWLLNTAVLWGMIQVITPLWAKVIADVLLFFIGLIPQRAVFTPLSRNKKRRGGRA